MWSAQGDSSTEQHCYQYTAKGGSKVVIPREINPRQVLGLEGETSADRKDIKAAFRQLITTPDRQQRAIVTYAIHMLDPRSGTRYNRRRKGRLADAFDYAISGDTRHLRAYMEENPGAMSREDSSGRTLLYIAARSGYYDTCEYLLKAGALANQDCGDDKSTPLHAASFYGHVIVCLLLVSHGAMVTARNRYDNTPKDEARDQKTRQSLTNTETNAIMKLAKANHHLLDGAGIQKVYYRGEVVAKVLRLPDKPPPGWTLCWHGTKIAHLGSILKNGLQPAGATVDGSLIQPPANHYRLGTTHFGLSNWANAIFVSPSVLYAGHPCYAEHVVDDSDQWCVLLEVYCRPKAFSIHKSTILANDPVPGEPAEPEWRVDVQGEDQLWRLPSASNIRVRAVVFVKLSLFDSIGEAGLDYQTATRLLSMC
jgi:hypothetical protein